MVLITLSFDCILAYKIGEQLYTIQGWMSLEAQPPYSLGLAIKDPNTWAVIFCGFIAYIIWGIVFDLVYTAYEDRISNKRQIDVLKKRIDKEEKRQQDLNGHKTTLQNTIARLEGNKKKLTQQLQNVRFDPVAIKTCLADFFTGWMSVMQAMGKTQDDQQSANDVYKETIDTLFKPKD